MRIVLIEDHPIMRNAVRALLTMDCPEADIVGEADEAREGVRLIEERKPDVVLLDMVLPGATGLSVLHEVRKQKGLRVIVFSALREWQFVTDAMSAGADGYVVKTQAVDDLVNAIRRVCKGERVVPRGFEDVLPWQSQDQGLASLSCREREVFDMILEGHTNESISAHLFISTKTVETHRLRINRKLNVHSAGQLFRYAAMHGVLSVSAQGSTHPRNLVRG
jgi:DNA-binding NarL/FixJ family response regulator